MRKTIFATIAIIVACAGIAACNETRSPNSTTVEGQIAEQNQAAVNVRYPIPVLQYSLERANLIRRAKRINGSENMTGCIDLISYGRVIAHYVVDGKVSSLNSYLLSGTKAVDVRVPSTTPDSIEIMEQADIDGAYGKNADGIFFFEAITGAYVEWQGDYLWSDICLRMIDEPLLVQTVADEDTPPSGQ